MKIEWNKKYTTIAVYAIIVIVLSALAIILLGKIPYFFTLLQKIIKILSPILYGFAFAYLLNFIMKFVETKLLKKMCDKKPRYKLRRILSISITYLITLLFLTVFFWIVLPQLIESLTTLINSVPQCMEYAN